jgi:hypothetical protein
MSQHVLLGLAARFPGGDPPDCAGWIYDRTVGAWVLEEDPSELMANPPRPRPGAPRPPPRPGPVSKKHDQETGEDMKGP